MSSKNEETQGQTRTYSNDHHDHGLMALSPLALFMLVILTGVAYWIFTQLQITSTEQSVFGLLQVSTQIQPGMTVGQVASFMSGNIDRYQTIAYAIGWGVQIALLLLAYNPASILMRMHKKYNVDSSPSMSQAASSTAKLRNFMMFVLVGGDILTDFIYVINGHSLLSWAGIVPSVTSLSAGIIVIAILYPITICFMTIFVGKYFFIYVSGLMHALGRKQG